VIENGCGPGFGLALYKRLFARYYDAAQDGYESYVAPRKRELFRGISGTVLEIGPGTGANLAYLPPGCRWLGVEPNPFMHDSLRRRAEQASISAEFLTGRAERIAIADGAADVVLSTLVLCSVRDLSRTLDEVRRVLRPGGRFLFIEHVIGESVGLRMAQWLMRPASYAFGDGCRTNRDIAGAIRAAGFASVALEPFRAPTPPVPPWISPHIAGEAIR
jgi:SAM-dependent methyltransferase